MNKMITSGICAALLVALSGCAETDSTNDTVIINDSALDNIVDVDNSAVAEDGNVSNASVQ